MKKIAVFLMVFLIMSFAAVAHADYTLTIFEKYLPSYTGDPEAFTTKCPSPIVENFEDTTLVSGLTITEINNVGTIHDGVYENSVKASGSPLNPLDAAAKYQIFNYSPSMYGFGAWFDLAGPGGEGSGIDVYINDNNQFVMSIPNTAEGQFYGFFSDTPFTGVRLQDAMVDEPNLYVQETYALIDLAVCPIPIPPSALLLGSGLLGLVFLRRRRKG
jgi:hypothetical protein